MAEEFELRVKAVAQSRGITTIKELAARCQLAYDTAADLWHGRMQRLDRAVLARVCLGLACDLNDILVLKRDESGGQPPNIVQPGPLAVAY